VRQSSHDAQPRQRGFTLVELLIVVVVLAVLAAVVIMAIGAFDNRGELAACKADAKSVERAVEAFRAKEGRYPGSLEELTQPPGNYLREVPNTQVGTGDYWIVYRPETGEVEGWLNADEMCAGELVMATPDPSGTPTEPGGPGGGGPGSGTPTPTATTTSPGTTTTSPAATTTSPATTSPGTTTSTSPGGGSTTTTTTAPGGGTTTTTATNPNPNPTPGQPGPPVVNCVNPPGPDVVDCTAAWAAPAGPVTRYEWQYVVNLGACPFFLSFPPFGGSGTSTTTAYTMDGLIPFVSYCFRVRAVNGSSVGPWSNVAAFVAVPD
jgi:prepilin-type N-terminal cleavage/methylation domain